MTTPSPTWRWFPVCKSQHSARPVLPKWRISFRKWKICSCLQWVLAGRHVYPAGPRWLLASSAAVDHLAKALLRGGIQPSGEPHLRVAVGCCDRLAGHSGIYDFECGCRGTRSSPCRGLRASEVQPCSLTVSRALLPRCRGARLQKSIIRH